MDSLFSNIDPALISAIMSDPEIVTLMSRPDIQQKMQMAASNPSLLSGMAQDPDIQRLIQKFQSLGLNPNSLIGSGPSPIPNPWSTPTSSVAPSAGSVIHISSKAQFDSLIRSSHNKLVAVDYTASWCGPCKFISPHFDRFASKYADHAVFLKVDVDKNQDIARERGIRSMPTFQFFVDGSVVAEFSGADSDKLENTISLHYERIQKKTNAISVKPSPYKHIPLKPEEIVSFQQCKFDVIKQKIMEFNGLPDCEKPLDANELQCLAGLVDVIADRKSFHRNTVSAEQKQLIVKTLQTWKSIHLPPLLNLLRMAIFHSSMDTWITVANLSQLLKSCDSNADCQLAALRMICNLFVRVSLRTVLIDNCESILELIRPLQSSKIGAIRSAYINVIINYAIIICDDHMQTNINAQSGKIQLLSVCADALQCAEDEKIAQRLLIIAGTLLYRDVTSKSIGQSLQLGDVCTQVAGHYPSAEINEICSEVKKTLDDDDN